MNNLLLILLVAIDLVLIGLVFIALRRKQSPDLLHMMRQLDHEHRLLRELRESVREQLEQKHGEMKQLYERVSAIATEAEVELKNSGTIVSHEVAQVLAEAQRQMEEPLKLMTRHRTRLSALIQKSQEERQILQKAMARAERLVRFFDKKIPYEEVLEEIEDKKYSDARFLLSKGLSPEQVAQELGLPSSEVQMIASIR